MSHKAVLDNDVIHKLSRYAMLSDACELGLESEPVGVLGAARYVVGGLLGRLPEGAERDLACAEFDAFIDVVDALEPTEDEIALAASLEEAALDAAVQVDGGETQLIAMALIRDIKMVVTGDKRAIRGVEKLLSDVDSLAGMADRLVCLEQLMSTLLGHLGVDSCRPRVCRAPCDKAISISFGCSSEDVDEASVEGGLLSYIEDLRRAAPTVLYPGGRITSN